MKAEERKKDQREFRADVAVVGGGTAGLAAAVAAARAGAETYLIEKDAFLGGEATGGLVSAFDVGPDVKGSPVIRGILEEIRERLKTYDAIRGVKKGGLPFDPEMMRFVAFDLCEDAGVRLLLHSLVFEVKTRNESVEELHIYSRGGPRRLIAQTYVDASGDGDIAALAGADFQAGRATDGLQLPMTLLFQLGNINGERVQSADWEKLQEVFEKELVPKLFEKEKLTKVFGKEVKILVAYRRRLGRISFKRVGQHGGLFGMGLIHVAGLDSLDVEDLTRAEIGGRRAALAIHQFFRKHVPGCERCIIARTADHVGVRETRRIIGDYILTREDVLYGRKFEDSIGCRTSWIDLHDPEGEGVLHELVVKDDWFEIPLRAIVVKGYDNLLVAGRCISATHEAQGAIRGMGSCMVTGQGAGVAAALAARQNISVGKLDVNLLQRELRAQGVQLD